MLSYVDPTFVRTGTGYTFIRVSVSGSNIPTNGIKIVLRRGSSADIPGTDILMDSTSQLKVSFNIPSGSNGLWDVVVFGSDGTTVLGTLTNGFTVN